jgi:hypothetical protein
MEGDAMHQQQNRDNLNSESHPTEQTEYFQGLVSATSLSLCVFGRPGKELATAPHILLVVLRTCSDLHHEGRCFQGAYRRRPAIPAGDLDERLAKLQPLPVSVVTFGIRMESGQRDKLELVSHLRLIPAGSSR